MTVSEADEAIEALRPVAEARRALRLLLVHGSRARGEAHEGSDWDLAYLADPDLDAGELHAAASEALGTSAVDLVDLARASALLRFEAARSARCVHEREPGAHEAFVLEATLFWCDVEPVLRRAYAEVLASLPER